MGDGEEAEVGGGRGSMATNGGKTGLDTFMVLLYTEWGQDVEAKTLPPTRIPSPRSLREILTFLYILSNFFNFLGKKVTFLN